MPNQGQKTVQDNTNSHLLRTLKRGVSMLSIGLVLGFAASASAQPTNFVVDITDPNVDVDLSVLNDGGLSPQMSAPMTGAHAPAAGGDGDVFKTPGTDVPMSTLHIKPSSRFKLPPQTKPIEAEPEPQIAAAPPAPEAEAPTMTAAAPVPVEVEPVPERLAEPEQVVTAPPPPPAIETPAAAPSEPAPKPAPEVAEVAPPPPPMPEPMPEAKPEPEPAPAPEVAAVSPPPPPPVVEESPAVAAPAPEPQPEPAAKPTPPPQPIVKAPEPPAPPAAPPMPPKAEAPAETAVLTPPPAPVAKTPATVIPVPPKQEASQTASLPAANGPLSDGDSLRIVFDEDSSKLSQTGRDALASIADKMKSQDNLRLQLLAYAGDEDTSASAARRLSLSRALAVRSYLIESGVRSTRIDVRALGNKSTEAVTERVDITVVER